MSSAIDFDQLIILQAEHGEGFYAMELRCQKYFDGHLLSLASLTEESFLKG